MLKSKVRETGLLNANDEPLYHQLVLEEKEFNKLENEYGSCEKISEVYNVDFISVIYDTDIDFIHVTNTSNKESIERLGLILSDSDYVPDLGKGVYVVDLYSDEGYENLKDFIADKDEEELLFIEGCYNGKVETCVYGKGHEGYVVINDCIDPDNLEIKVMSVDDILLSDITEFQY